MLYMSNITGKRLRGVGEREVCAHDSTLAIWVSKLEMAFRYRAAKWTCAQTSGQGGFGSDQQRGVAVHLRPPERGM